MPVRKPSSRVRDGALSVACGRWRGAPRLTRRMSPPLLLRLSNPPPPLPPLPPRARGRRAGRAPLRHSARPPAACAPILLSNPLLPPLLPWSEGAGEGRRACGRGRGRGAAAPDAEDAATTVTAIQSSAAAAAAAGAGGWRGRGGTLPAAGRGRGGGAPDAEDAATTATAVVIAMIQDCPATSLNPMTGRLPGL